MEEGKNKNGIIHQSFSPPHFSEEAGFCSRQVTIKKKNVTNKKVRGKAIARPTSVPTRLLASMAGVGVGGGEFRHSLWAQKEEDTLCGRRRRTNGVFTSGIFNASSVSSSFSKVYYRPE